MGRLEEFKKTKGKMQLALKYWEANDGGEEWLSSIREGGCMEYLAEIAESLATIADILAEMNMRQTLH